MEAEVGPVAEARKAEIRFALEVEREVMAEEFAAAPPAKAQVESAIEAELEAQSGPAKAKPTVEPPAPTKRPQIYIHF